ncbi:polysaccharide pyruvyl transferase family protein [Paenibacillus sp. FJAT-26967]|uniref:polysaccharide pyruvyl transferase family protein n=1 Tax=Paenibacillus sp. FJAT-26967 TaxID=1729690 RepID=UPI0008398F6D|nr:polysaccharide pyruvyl transferase family protein [Paenibacillus sp. FJAT-26967]
MKHILLAGVPHSTNLGDGLIAMTVNQLIRTCGDYTITNFDLTAGLYNEPQVTKADKEGKVYKLNEVSVKKKLTPDFLRYVKSYSVHKKKDRVLNDQIRQLVADSDAVLIGGGHLFIDTYLSFPIAMRRLVMEVRRQRKPLHIVFVGMRGPWSFLARRWFTEILQYAKTISVRDEDSLAYLLSFDSSLARKAVALSDPALVTREAFPEPAARFSVSSRMAAKQGDSSVQTIGLGIMDPNEMRRHSPFLWDRDDCADWWYRLAQGVVEGGGRVRIFTNGADTDNAFVEHYIKPRLAAVRDVEFASYPADVSDLVDSIRDCDAVIAQRLHACIPAISFGKPTYGIAWDKKLASIFKDLGLSQYVVDFRSDPRFVLAQMAPDTRSQEGATRIVNDKKRDLVAYVGRILNEA